MNLLQKTSDKIKDNHEKAKNFYFKALHTLKPLDDDIRIKIEPYNKINDALKESISIAFESIFDRTLKEHEIHWARPQWVGTVLLYKKLAGFCYVIESEVFFDNKIVRIGGLGGVATLPSHRGLGIASKLLTEVDKFLFKELKVDYGLLVCKKSLRSFYENKNWYVVDCPVFYSKNNKIKKFKGSTMLKNTGEDYQPRQINIMGKLW